MSYRPRTGAHPGDGGPARPGGGRGAGGGEGAVGPLAPDPRPVRQARHAAPDRDRQGRTRRLAPAPAG
ncbi:MAG: hypothetical protein WDN45_03530 [Caulobacteraceae bacterium]